MTKTLIQEVVTDSSSWKRRIVRINSFHSPSCKNLNQDQFSTWYQNKVTVLIVCVDDIIITGDDIEEIKCLGQNLSREFDIKSLGRLKYFLRIEVAYSKGVFLSQHKYILDLLQETGKLECKPADTPIDPNLSLGEGKESDQVDKSSYQRLIGRLIYLNHTRPDNICSECTQSAYE
ncbi:unnamed protein product [Spirodela intermedia]|uniref:Reverse transcriptase Ty1/copia-type domain-containing protein n=1 Tax=Spirodela intermedia TaxID=51605 RepID=A0A7I8K239_SPIIN|nr:unnamed protein product [Spirodela intermedia]